MKSIRLENITFDQDSVANIKLTKVDDNGNEQPHRTIVPPGTNIGQQLQAVNGHLAQMGYPPLTGKPLADLIKSISDRHTPAVINAWNNRPTVR